jgi:TonB family protein
MADTKALFTQRFDAARTAWTHGDEPAAAESLRQAIVAARSDHSLRRELASALFHLGKLSRKLGQAGEAEAGPLLSEALAIGEELFGSEGAALAPVLHELSRLHLQRSQHVRAEDTLRRLLAITRVKGEEHPDVAATLVDLAFVKRKLGDDASAEALYREALRIREKVLEPNHMITVGTLERLSETCAARGNFAEALALLHRALPAREAALGAGHERVRAARSRVADLESRVAIAADTVAARATRDPVDTPSTHAPSPVNSKDLEFVTGRESGAAYSDVILADLAHSDVAPEVSAPSDGRSTDAPIHADSSEPARNKRTVRYAYTGAAAVVIAIAGVLMLRPRAGGGAAVVSTEMSAAQRTSAAGALVVTAPATRTMSIGTRAAMTAATHADSLRVASTTPVPTAAAIQREQRAPETAAPELRAPRVKLHLDSISMPAAPSVDAILRSAMERQRASDTARTQTRDEISRPTSAEVDHAHSAPKLMGRPPEPAFPDALLRSGPRDGQVVVRFMVDEDGTVDVASMIVERSDHELFTAAVREVLPRFRFEPAHTLTPESKPVAAWVSVPFRFTTKKR